MELLHSGFDNLDIAFSASLDEAVLVQFHAAQESARLQNRSIFVSINGIGFNVASSGKRGGYAYRADTGPFGEIWSFKVPNKRDAWGIHVSVSALQVALRGLAKTRSKIEERLALLGVTVRPGMESISRIDFAMDFLIPDFEPDPNHFVMHPRFVRKEHGSLTPYTAAGPTGRIQTVMIGKNPGRQVVVYDKRAEVLSKGKRQWLEVWNINRAKQGLPPLDIKDAAISRVWRVELRAYKKHLKEHWKVSTWWQLQSKLPDILCGLLDDIRYTEPSADQQRTRWPNHPLWNRAHEVLEHNLLSMQSFASEHRIMEIQRTELIQMITAQIAGCTITLSALRREPDLEAFLAKFSKELAALYRSHPERTQHKLSKARETYP